MINTVKNFFANIIPKRKIFKSLSSSSPYMTAIQELRNETNTHQALTIKLISEVLRKTESAKEWEQILEHLELILKPHGGMAKLPYQKEISNLVQEQKEKWNQKNKKPKWNPLFEEQENGG